MSEDIRYSYVQDLSNTHVHMYVASWLTTFHLDFTVGVCVYVIFDAVPAIQPEETTQSEAEASRSNSQLHMQDNDNEQEETDNGRFEIYIIV